MRCELRALVVIVAGAAAIGAAPAEASAESSSSTPEPGGDTGTTDAEAAEPSGPPFAVGLSTGWLRRNEYGDRTRNAFVPELLGLTYVETGRERLYLRPGVRLGYVGLAPAEMPSSLRFVERDATLGAEIGALYDGVVIPTASIGAGLTLRRLSLAVGAPIAAEEQPPSRWEFLPSAYAQVGAGVPFARGAPVVEPFGRFEVLVGDDRARWRYGVDFTFALR